MRDTITGEDMLFVQSKGPTYLFGEQAGSLIDVNFHPSAFVVGNIAKLLWDEVTVPDEAQVLWKNIQMVYSDIYLTPSKW